MVTAHDAFPADGFEAAWETVDGAHTEHLSLRWDNEAWTASGRVGAHDVEYVIRLSPLWQVRQFLLFRDLEEPDLWLGTDGAGRWGEVNGAHRPELDGTRDITLACTPFGHVLPIRRLPLEVGHAAEIRVLDIDVETLGVVPIEVVYERLGERRWHVRRPDTAGGDVDFEVDHHGVPTDVPGRFRRLA